MDDYTYEGLKRRNLSKELDRLLQGLEGSGSVPRLFLHSCCAPCSSYVLEYLSRYMRMTVFYYNPNITEREEYRKRVLEQQRFIAEFPAVNPIDFIEGDYEPQAYRAAVSGLEGCAEGGARCHVCYRLRLERTVQEAVRLGGYDYYSTTLSISPLKDSAKLGEIGYMLGQRYGLPYLLSDFKKKNGYKRSVELSAEYGLYRQNYCGCEYSRRN
jgi:hypothetical protein